MLPESDAYSQTDVCQRLAVNSEIAELAESQTRRGWQLTWWSYAGLCLDNDIKGSGVVVQVPFVYSQKQHTVSLSYKVSPCPDQEKIVIIVSDYGD
jgi:predicted dithiol-disulfide oxidoreductase (DUF899 family)